MPAIPREYCSDGGCAISGYHGIILCGGHELLAMRDLAKMLSCGFASKYVFGYILNLQ